MKKNLFFILFLSFFFCLFLLFSLSSSAAPMNDNTVSVNASITSLKKYVDNKVAQNGANDNVLIDVGQSVTSGILEELLPSALQPDGISSYIDTSEFIDAYENNDMSYFQATFGIYYESDYDNLLPYLDSISDYIIDSVNSDILVYESVPLSRSGDWVNNELNGANVYDEIFHQYVQPDGDITPIYYYRSRQQWGTTSFIDTNNNNSLCVDGLVCTSYSSQYWGELVQYLDYYRLNGYLPENCHSIDFHFYNNSARVNSPFFHTISHLSTFPQVFSIDPYVVISSEGIGHQSGIMSVHNGDYVFLLFRSQAAYLKYNSSTVKPVLPYDFSLNFPNTDFSSLDFSQILKAIRDNGVLETRNTQELYKRLNETLEQGIQDIIDGQKTTNELLLSLLRYYDKNIVKNGENITEILLKIASVVVPSGEEEEEINTLLDDTLNSAMNNNSLSSKFGGVFPFSVFADTSRVINYFGSFEILEPRWDFVVSLGDVQIITIDLRDVPGIEIARSIFMTLCIIIFNIAMLKLEFKFFEIYFS